MESTRDYISVEQSIIGSLIEVKLMQAGKLPKKTWQEARAEIEQEISEEESHMETTRDYISVEQSIIDSLIEVKMMQAGLLSEPTLEDFFAHIEAIIKEEETHENSPDAKLQ